VTEPYLDAVPACPMEWEYMAVSIAAGSVPKSEVCNKPATVLMVIKGVPTLVCVECADELRNKHYAKDPSDGV
jgi:hypothetical protein